MTNPTAANLDYSGGSYAFTAAGASTPTTVAIDNITGVEKEAGGEHKTASGDDAPGPTVGAVRDQTRKVTITTFHSHVADLLKQGVLGVLTWVHQDVHNGAGPGSITYTVSRCKFVSSKDSSKKAEVGSIDLMFEALWSKDVSGNWVDPIQAVEAPAA